MAACAGGHRHLRVIKLGRRPVGRLGANAGGMARLAAVAGGHVIALLADRLAAVVATEAVGDDAGMVEVRAQPGVRGVAITAFKIGGDVVGGLAGSLNAVMADDAKA